MSNKVEFNEEKIELFFKGKDADREYISRIFEDKRHEKKLLKLLSRQFDEMKEEEMTQNANLEHILSLINYRIVSKTTEENRFKLNDYYIWASRIAAILLIPLLLFFTYRNARVEKLNNATWIEINAPAWTRIQFNLPDGTKGWLNSNSKLRYKGNFISNRQVKLEGEAFFDVRKNPDRPFTVSADNIQLKVLGTRFNISSYRNENNIEVVLEEGSLLFNDPKSNKQYTMVPNDLITYDKTRMDFSTKPVQAQKYLSWKEGKLVFRNDPLDVIARRVGRWYNVDVEVNVEICQELSLFATFTDENLEEVLELLKQSLPIDYRIESGNLNPDKTYAKKKVIIIPGKTNLKSH
jgi:ferric-dicitrate binding protein FerR (iron transport regulator)